jgi:IMP dehydrogenase
MKEMLTFDDVLIVPKFSKISSRKEVELFEEVLGDRLYLPVISANMDTITGPRMCRELAAHGARGCLHRFCSIEDNVEMFKEAILFNNSDQWNPWVSIGLGMNELERAEALRDVGAHCFVIDVAHGAQAAVTSQVKVLRELIPSDHSIVVGNFATGDSVKDFLEYTGSDVNGIKVGIGPGSACTTRIKTGVGYPQLSAVMEIASTLKHTDIVVIADGGMKTPGDIAKAIGAGAHLVMLGGMLSGTNETPGDIIDVMGDVVSIKDASELSKIQLLRKKYRGSASKEAYESQGKDASWRTAEGESFYVNYKGPVKDILQDIEGGLRSAMTYVGASNIREFHGKVEFVRVSNATRRENGAHGKVQS